MAQIALNQVSIDPIIALKVPSHVARRSGSLAYARVEDKIYIAAKPNSVRGAASTLSRYLPSECEFVVESCPVEQLENAYQQIYGTTRPAVATTNDEEQTRTTNLVNQILDAAALSQASDIHFNPEEKSCHCRLRINGYMRDHSTYPISEHQRVVSRIKVLANLDISERRIPQDGKFRYGPPNNSRPIDIRVATIPTLCGEKITLRLIGSLELPESFENLGLSPQTANQLEQSLDLPQGMIIVTGPTGSGKSTTLYTCLKKLSARRNLNLISLEDPVEYELEGVNQIAITPEHTSFEKALRSSLRHDPDVLLVGEIRDAETAEIAIRAALTGHLVLSTLHTNSAAGAPQRLIDMGIPSYLISSTLSLVLSQRLVRQLCQHCKEQTTHSFFGQAFHANGCKYCQGNGYKQRMGIFECLLISSSVSQLITEDAREETIQKKMQELNMLSLVEDAKSKVAQGLVDANTAFRAISASLLQ